MNCSSGKISFSNERRAWVAVIGYNLTGAPVGDVYKCPRCKTWHVTSKRDNKPYWVNRAIKQRKIHEKYKERAVNSLSQAEIKEALKKLHNKPLPKWQRFVLSVKNVVQFWQ